MSKSIKVRNAVKKYGDQTIISNLSLDIRRVNFSLSLVLLAVVKPHC